MPESRKQTIMLTCTIIACIVTLLTCGVLIGGAKSDIGYVAKEVNELSAAYKDTVGEVSAIKTDQAFQKGVVQTQLTTQGLAIVRIENKLDDLIKVD